MSIKKNALAALSIVIALAVFSVSALAAASNLSGYDKLKTALFGMTESSIDNVTVSAQARVVKDGAQLDAFSMVSKVDGDKSYSIASGGFGASANESYSDLEGYLSIIGDEYYQYAYEEAGYYEEGGITATQRRFMELLLDTLVGDVKNYFVSDGDQVSVTLTGQQVPELAQLAISVMAEEMNKSGETFNLEHGHEFSIGPDAKISLASFNGTVDGQDVLTDAYAQLTLTSTVNGELQTLDLYVDLHVTDIGTTVVTKPDLTGKTEMDGGRYAITYNYDGEEYEIERDMMIDRDGTPIVITESAARSFAATAED